MTALQNSTKTLQHVKSTVEFNQLSEICLFVSTDAEHLFEIQSFKAWKRSRHAETYEP